MCRESFLQPLNVPATRAYFHSLEMAPVLVLLRPSRRIQRILPSSLVHALRMGVDSSSAACVQRGPSQDVRCTSTKDHQAPSPPRSASRKSTRLSIPAEALPNMLIPMYPASNCFKNIGRMSLPEYERRSSVSVTMSLLGNRRRSRGGFGSISPDCE